MEALSQFLWTGFFIPSIALITALLAVLAGFLLHRLRPSDLGRALLWTVELLGLVVLFFCANLITGFLLIELVNLSHHRPASHYLILGYDLQVFSLLEGIIARVWIDSPRLFRAQP